MDLMSKLFAFLPLTPPCYASFHIIHACDVGTSSLVQLQTTAVGVGVCVQCWRASLSLLWQLFAKRACPEAEL